MAIDPLLLPQEAADLLRSTPSTLAKLRLFGAGPPFVKIGRLVRYRQSDLDAWIATRTATSTSGAA